MQEPTEAHYKLRPATSADAPFILDSWLNCLRSEYPQLPDDLFFPAYRELIRRLLLTAQVRILDHGGVIAGYSVSWDSEGVLHWVYVMQKYRQSGLAKQLLSHLPPYRSHTFR